MVIQQDITPKMIKQADINISKLLNPKKESIYCKCSIYLSGRKNRFRQLPSDACRYACSL